MLKFIAMAVLALSLTASVSGQSVSSMAGSGDRQYDWLEKPVSLAALKWAKDHTAAAYRRLLSGPEAADILKEVNEVSKASSTPPPYVEPYSILGNEIARFVSNSDHPAGLIETAPLSPAGVIGSWRTVLDVDALNAHEGKSYGLPVLKLTANCLPPEYRRCLIPLGINGSEVQEYREFDIQDGKFLEDGFRFAAAKTEVAWLDENTLLVGQAVPGEILRSSFPARVRLWKRGTAYADARIIFSPKPGDSYFRLSAIGDGVARKGVIIDRDASNAVTSFVVGLDGSVTATGLPSAVSYPGNLGLSGGTARYIVVATDTAIVFLGRNYPERSVFAYDTDYKTPASRRISLIYTAPPGTYLYDAQFGFTFSKSYIYMITAHDMARSLLVARHGDHGWVVKKLIDVAPGETMSLWGGNTETDTVVMGRQGYLTPESLTLVKGERCCIPISTKPSAFDSSRFVTDIRMAKASDGTLIPYYLVRPKNSKPGPVPTILTAYGASAGVVDPAYATKWLDGGLVSWLDRGGAYAYAAIRGGGEKGDAWHRAGMLANKPQGLDDVAAVAEDLIRSGFTSPEHLGLTGRSYGGLMATAVAVRHPDLFAAVLPGVPVADLLPLPDSVGFLSLIKSELGDPNNAADRAVMLSYSGFENIRPGVKYPRFLTFASTSDDRVGPGSARRYTAKLEAEGADAMYIEGATGGHLFPKSSTDPKAVTAEVMFFIDALMR